jgi:transcriptional regulator with XRE-family HTH domain
MFGDTVRETRKRLHLTRVQLFAKSGVHFNTIADIENGRNKEPSFEKVIRLSRALNLNPLEAYPVKD